MSMAYFDCFSGAGGDMIVAALLDAGADAEALRRGIARLRLDGFTIGIEKVKKQGFAATRFQVVLDSAHKPTHRHLKHVREIINAGDLSPRVRDLSLRTFERLAEAEAKVHGSTVEKVHFHEVGAIDSIVDVVGAALALESLGIQRVICSALPTGSGTVTCEHGVMPVPAPGTAELIRGVPIAPCDEPGELLTPTAAAVLTTVAEGFGLMPAMLVRGVGYGAGTRDGHTRPNLLRVFVGEARGGDANGVKADRVEVLETNLDDASPQAIAHCVDRLLAAGALDAFATPIQMKKSRPGVMLTVLCDPSNSATMEAIIFRETPTLGVRRSIMERSVLPRRSETVSTPFGKIRVKIVERLGRQTVAAEYDDAHAAAITHDVALQEVQLAAQEAWESLRGS